MDGEAVRPDLHLLVAEGSRVQHNLDVMLVLVMVFVYGLHDDGMANMMKEYSRRDGHQVGGIDGH